MTKYWTADSDRDWQDSVGMYADNERMRPHPKYEGAWIVGPDEEEPVNDTPERAPPMSRAAALEAFFVEVALAIPESDPDWLAKRERVRRAGVAYACAATKETVDSTNRTWLSLR